MIAQRALADTSVFIGLEAARWETKRAWYDAHFPGRLVTTVDSGDLTKDAAEPIKSYFTA